MEKTFQYHQQIFAGLELEIYNDLLKKDKIFLQCGEWRESSVGLFKYIHSVRWPILKAMEHVHYNCKWSKKRSKNDVICIIQFSTVISFAIFSIIHRKIYF